MEQKQYSKGGLERNAKGVPRARAGKAMHELSCASKRRGVERVFIHSHWFTSLGGLFC